MTIHSRETGECLALTRGVVENRHCIWLRWGSSRRRGVL